MHSNIINQIIHILQSHSNAIFSHQTPPYSQRQQLTSDIIHSLKNSNPNEIILKYTNSKRNPSFEHQNYFKVLVSLINLFPEDAPQSTLLKDILQKLLQIEKNSPQYLKLVPKHLFLSIKKYNPVTYERKEKKMLSKSEIAYYSNTEFADCSKGFAEITLAVCNYFNDSNMEIQSVWERILWLAGKYQLDFGKITEIIVDLLPTVINQGKIAGIIKMLDSKNTVLYLVTKLFPQNKPDVAITYCGPISSLVQKHTGQLEVELKTTLNSKYLMIFHACLQANVFSEYHFQSFLPSTNPLFLLQRERQLVTLLNQMVQKYFSKGFQQMQVHPVQQVQKKAKTLMMGQLIGCHKFNMMHERLKSNKFQQFRLSYRKLSSVKITITLSAPIIKVFCQLIEWMLDPFLQKYSQKQFIKHEPSSGLQFKQGYFQPISKVTLQFMGQLQEIFQFLQIYVGFSTTTFQKLCRAFTIFLSRQNVQEEVENFAEIKRKIANIIKSYLLGGLSLQASNPLPSLSLSLLLKAFSQKQRFRMYEDYLKNTMFQNLHLVYHLERVSKLQNSLLNKIQFNSTLKELLPLLRLQWNYPFQSLYQISKRLLTSFFQAFMPSIVSMIFQAPFISKDIMLYFCLDFLCQNQPKLMREYDIVNECYKTVMNFLFHLFRQDKEIQFDIFLQITLAKLNESIQEPSASQMVVPHYNRNFVLLKLIASSLEETCPLLSDLISSTNDRYDYLQQGYFMRLSLVDKTQQFGKNNLFRSKLFSSLCKMDKRNISYLLCFLSALNSHLKKLNFYDRRHQEGASKTMQKHGRTIDQCMSVSTHFIRFFFIQLKLTDQADLMSFPISFQEVCQLISSQQLQFSLGCCLLRELKKNELQQGRHLDLKKRWMKLINKKFESAKNVQGQEILISKQRVLYFVKSDLFFYFWLSSLPHVVWFEDKYNHKITELRRKFQGKQLQEHEKEKLLLGYRYLVSQKQQLHRSYQAFNLVSHPVPVQSPSHRNMKFDIPSEYSYWRQKVKLEDGKPNQFVFKEFVNLFFTYCLLPRILVDPCESIFCSKFLFRIIKENKMPSNKSVLMIFTIIEAAIGYVQFATERQATKCIPVFVNDLLRIFKNWNNCQSIQNTLLIQISMQRFTAKRYQILKGFISDFILKVTSLLTNLKDEPFITRNAILFIDKVDSLPLSIEQGQEFIHYLKQVIEKLGSNIGIKIAAERLQNVLQKRMSTAASIKSIMISRQTKQDATRARTVAQTSADNTLMTKQPQTEKEPVLSKLSSLKKAQKKQKIVVIDLEEVPEPSEKPKSAKPAQKKQPRNDDYEY